MRGPGLRGGPDSSGGPEPQLLALERLPLPGHMATPDLPQSWNGSGLLLGEQEFGPQGSGCLDVVKDNYKGPCLDTARGGTPVLGYRQACCLSFKAQTRRRIFRLYIWSLRLFWCCCSAMITPVWACLPTVCLCMFQNDFAKD